MERLDGCLDTNDVVAFLSGSLESRDLARFEAHVARCEHCRKLLALVARTSGSSMSSSAAPQTTMDVAVGSPSRDHGTQPMPGTHVGRYVLRERLGGGAMGVVFSARDPQLDRSVAVKLLRSELVVDPSRTPLDARLLREAQAMAQLAHPNVVAVYDVGAFGDRIFIAMELVEGQTLAQWLLAKRRPLHDVITMFIAAGRGLAAAHAAGLVHRDFKPENVLLGNDGRVRVTDFGLAHRAAIPGDRVAGGPAVIERDRVSTAVLAGTPYYMAPEQLAGERVDARSDQFSFCVAIYAALTGEHPFRTGDRSDGPLAGRPRRDAMPSWLWHAIRPGLAVDRDRRYRSMDALLSRLAIAPRRRRRVGAAVAGAAIALSVVVGIAATRDARDRSPICQGAERLLAGVWDPQRTGAVEAAFRANGGTDAATTFVSASLLLDQYAKRWTAMRTQACERAVPGMDPESLSSLRIGCLDARLSELRELTGRLAVADASLVDRAVIQIQRLGKLESCADDAALQRSHPSDAARPGLLLALDADHRLHYFATDSETTLWQIPTAADGAEGPPIFVSDAVIGSPSLVVDASHRWQLFARKAEGTVWHGWQDEPGGPWHGETVAYEVTDSPSVVLAGDRLVFFARKTDGWLWRYWQDAPSSHAWTSLRVTDVVVGRPGVGLDEAGNVYAFVRKADGSIWHTGRVRPRDPLEHPVKLVDDVSGDPTLTRDVSGPMTYFARRANGVLMAGYQDLVDRSVWHKFWITEQIAGNPAMAIDQDGRQICMSRAADGSLWHGIQHVPGGGPWDETIVTTGIVGDPAIIQGADNRTIYVVRKTDGLLWQGRQDVPRGTTWHEHVLPWSGGNAGQISSKASR